MSSLHLVSIAPTAGTALTDCLRVARAGDALLLLGDGVYALAAPAAMAALAQAAATGIALHALVADSDARGLASRVPTGITLVDDNGFVALTEKYARCISWF